MTVRIGSKSMSEDMKTEMIIKDIQRKELVELLLFIKRIE